MTSITTKIRLYLLPGLLFLGMVGCQDFFDLFDNKDKHFPLEEKYRIKFKEGDTLKYLDQKGNTFQMVISKIVYDNRTVSRKGSSGPYDIIDRETVHYDSALINLPVVPMAGRNIYTVHPDGYVIWEPGLYGLGGALFYEQITLNSNVYNSVFKYSGNPRPPAYITTWYYSYAYGFVGFELQNGQLFTLMTP
jgi:hypothetical protein